MPRLIVNAAELYYEIAGSGPRLLFISGTGSDLRNRPNVFDSPLARHFEILAYDQRGLGQSAGGAGGASYPLHQLVDLPDDERLVRQLALSDQRRDAAWRTAHPEELQRLLAFARQAQRADRNEAGAALQLGARAGHDTWDRLPQIRIPVLLAGGQHDGIAPVDNM